MLTPTDGVAIPLVVYHAPVGQNGSRSDYYGALIGFASAQLQTPGAIYAGDFNVVTRPAQAALRVRSQALGYDLDTYIQQGPGPSVVHYVNHDATGYRTGQQVFGSGRDYAFIRKNQRDVSTVIYDALTALRGAMFVDGQPSPLNASVAGATADLDERFGGVRVGDVVQAYLAGHALPDGTDERTALAIIYRALVTDHLPVAIRYQV